MGLGGSQNRTYDQILENGKNRNYRQNSKPRGLSAMKASKKRRNKLNQSHNGVMGSIKEGGIAHTSADGGQDNFGPENMVDAMNQMHIA